jgi:hypothetical protein
MVTKKMRCVACNNPNPRKEDSTYRFCNKKCQNIFYSVGLKDDGIDDDDVVGLQSSDGKYYRIQRKYAIKMRTIKDLVEDAGVDHYIPIPNVAGDVLDIIISYISLDTVPTDLAEIYKPAFGTRPSFWFLLAEAISYLDVEYMMYATPILQRISRSLEPVDIGAFFGGYAEPIALFAASKATGKLQVLSAIINDNAEWLQMLIWKKEDVTFTSQAPLLLALERKATKCLDLLPQFPKKNTRVNAGYTLEHAVWHKDAEIVQFLMIGVQLKRIVEDLVSSGEKDILDFLLNLPNTGIDPNDGLLYACSQLYVEMVEFFLHRRYKAIDFERIITATQNASIDWIEEGDDEDEDELKREILAIIDRYREGRN